MASYVVPDLPSGSMYRKELVIKRSRFMVSIGHAPGQNAAKAFIERIRQEFPDATHNCWAFAAGAPGDTGYAGYSDDGEPHGTAGRPMLTVLLHCEVGEIAAVVTRYFGGIKLGTGGLVRAYQDMVRLGLEDLPLREHMIAARLLVQIGYAHAGQLKRLLPAYRGIVDKETFAADVSCELLIPREETAAFRLALQNLTDGTAIVHEMPDCDAQ